MTAEQSPEKYSVACKPCVFAEYENRVQTGCQLGRLQIFKDRKETSFEPESNSYIINRICSASRGNAWANSNLGRNLIALVEKEVRVRVDVVITCDHDDDKYIVSQLLSLVSACVNQEQIKPISISCVIKNDSIIFKDLYYDLEKLIGLTDIKLHIIKVVEQDADHLRMADMGIDKCSGQYMALFDLSDHIPLNLLKVFNEKINQELLKISMVESPGQFTPLIIQVPLCKILAKNKGYSVIDKVKDLAKDQKLERQITSWEPLWTRQKLPS
jgi:hypothetical protein